MIAKTKYGQNLGRGIEGIFYPAGTRVEILTNDDHLVQKIAPGIIFKKDAHIIPVQFPGRDHVTLLLDNELIHET